jgi:hypothetical protein
MDKEREANPGWYIGGQVAGAIPSMLIPGGGVARGASLAATARNAALAGGAAGGIYGFGSGDSLADRAIGAGQGAGFGAAVGGAVPLAGRAVGAGWGAFRNRGADNGAASLFERTAMRDSLSPQDLGRALADLGPEAIPADVGQNLLDQAGGLASMPGPGQRIIRDTLDARSAGANTRIQGEVDATLGQAPIPSRVDEGIRANQQALSPEYQAALNNATAVDTGDIALLLDSQIVNLRGKAQQAVRNVRDMLNVVGTDQLDPNPATLLEIRKAIDGQLAGEVDTNVIRVLSEARRRVDEVLADAVPGIKDVDAKFAELARQRDALGRGQQVLDSGRTAPRPAELADEVAAGAQPQGNAIGPSAVPVRLREGARAEIDRIIGTNSNDVVALNKMIKGEGSWNRDRLATLFGQDRADRIIALVDRERTFGVTANEVTRNSKSAARLASQRDIDPDTAAIPRIPWSLLDAVPRAANWMVGHRGAATQEARNQALADLLMARTPPGGQNPAVESMTAAIARRNRALAVGRALEYGLTPAVRGGVVPQVTPR